jgi:hypothetical protein
MLTAAIATPKISFDTVAMISFSAVARRGGSRRISPKLPELLQRLTEKRKAAKWRLCEN